jgi:hypothetical protein
MTPLLRKGGHFQSAAKSTSTLKAERHLSAARVRLVGTRQYPAELLTSVYSGDLLLPSHELHP